MAQQSTHRLDFTRFTLCLYVDPRITNTSGLGQDNVISQLNFPNNWYFLRGWKMSRYGFKLTDYTHDDETKSTLSILDIYELVLIKGPKRIVLSGSLSFWDPIFVGRLVNKIRNRVFTPFFTSW